MDYALAKQLKDAGWPQIRPNSILGEPNIFQLIYPDGFLEVAGEDLETRQAIGAYAPTLDELMAACGEGLSVEHIIEMGTWKNVWLARKPVVGLRSVAKGDTPSDAVARLWLELHKSS